jgi:hypothetical protein
LDNISLRNIVAQADELYAARADVAKVEESIELLRAAGLARFEIAWRLSRALFFFAQEMQAPSEARKLHAEGVKAGRLAAQARSDRVEGHFWLGVNLALLAQLDSAPKALVPALQASSSLQRAIDINSAYHAAGPLRVLARLQHKLPRLLGGGAARARENFERAIAIAPANTVTRIYFAQLLLQIGAVDRARSELNIVLSAPLDPDWAFEIKRDQRLARELMKKLPRPRKP